MTCQGLIIRAFWEEVTGIKVKIKESVTTDKVLERSTTEVNLFEPMTSSSSPFDFFFSSSLDSTFQTDSETTRWGSKEQQDSIKIVVQKIKICQISAQKNIRLR